MPPKWRTASFFIPAQNSRHRTACLTLYRALLKLSSKVALPSDLLSNIPLRTRSPIAHQIYRAFSRNRADTSPRLVAPALKAGYRMLETLHRAAEPASPEHTSIIRFLRSRQAERSRSLSNGAARPPAPRPSSAPKPETVPLLIRTTPAPTRENPHPRPSYAPAARPRSRSDLPPGRRRRVPVLDMAADLPLLRLGRPQPALLNRVLTQKIRARVKRGNAVSKWTDEGVPDCLEEDEWERRVADLLDREVVERYESGRLPAKGTSERNMYDVAVEEVEQLAGSVREDTGTYARTLKKYGIAWTMTQLSRDREDAVARADAMRKIIKEEKELAEQEKEETKRKRTAAYEERMRDRFGHDWKQIVAQHREQRTKQEL